MKSLDEIKWENNRFTLAGGPKSLKITPKQSGAVVIPKIQNKFLLEKIKRADGQYHFEFPRGFQDNERLIDTAKRELFEETHLKANQMIDLGPAMADSGLINGSANIYLAKIDDMHQQIKLQESENIIDSVMVFLPEMLDMVSLNKIIDGYSLSAIAKYLANSGLNIDRKISENVRMINNLADL